MIYTEQEETTSHKSLHQTKNNLNLFMPNNTMLFWETDNTFITVSLPAIHTVKSVPFLQDILPAK